MNMSLAQAETILDPVTISELRSIGDDAFVTELLTIYVDQASHVIEILRTSLQSRNAAEFARAAHSLAGASLHMGAVGVAIACRKAEQDLRSPDALPAPAHLAAIEGQLVQVLEVVAAG
jgi:HPt (histidine-containing phosphotransfer) domain-containing protein